MWRFISNACTFIFIYLCSACIVEILRFLDPKPKLLYIRSKGIYNFIVFPCNIIFRRLGAKKEKIK